MAGGLSGRVVVDWGSSNFRAYRFAGDGAMVESHAAAAGILSVTNGDYAAVLVREIGGWLAPGVEVLLSGMITSRNGWVETPYVPCPATLGALAAGAITRPGPAGSVCRFLPGVSALAPTPDVMRGEEIQVFGVVDPDETATVVLPGTHSKWVQVEKGVITGFRTFLTGEVYALLKGQSIIGRLIPPGEAPFSEAAFLDGVEQANAEVSISLLNDVFTARSGALLGAFGVEMIADRLSGLLIGHELKAGLSLPGARHGRLVLVGDPSLVTRYAAALQRLGRRSDAGPPHAAVDGFSRLVASA